MTTAPRGSATVRFLGPIRRPWPEASREVTVGEGCTVAELLLSLGFARPELSHLQVAVDGAVATPATPVTAGSRVDVMLRVGGG